MITTPAAATFLFFTGAVTAGALDLKDLSPCRTAAARLCCSCLSEYSAASRRRLPTHVADLISRSNRRTLQRNRFPTA